MGKGDKKSRRGKIHIGSYGVRRARKPGSKAPLAAIRTEEPVKKPKARASEKPKPPKVEAPVAEADIPQVEAVEKPAAKKTTKARSASKKSKPAEPPADAAGS